MKRLAVNNTLETWSTLTAQQRPRPGPYKTHICRFGKGSFLLKSGSAGAPFAPDYTGPLLSITSYNYDTLCTVAYMQTLSPEAGAL